jgi:hypothetical protein
MTALSPYFARKSLDRLTLSDGVRKHAHKLLELADADHRIQVARIHSELFPLNTPASANAALNRLLNTLNDAAGKQGIALTAHITADKKGERKAARSGSRARWKLRRPPIPPN